MLDEAPLAYSKRPRLAMALPRQAVATREETGGDLPASVGRRCLAAASARFIVLLRRNAGGRLGRFFGDREPLQRVLSLIAASVASAVDIGDSAHRNDSEQNSNAEACRESIRSLSRLRSRCQQLPGLIQFPVICGAAVLNLLVFHTLR